MRETEQKNMPSGGSQTHEALSNINAPRKDVNQYNQPQADKVEGLAKKAARWAVVLVVARQIVTIATTMVVSRFVSPEDVGTVSMVATMVAFIVLLDTGLTWATVQPKELTKEQVDGMFWAGVIIGSVLWLICIAVGPILVEFYRNDHLKIISTVMGAAPFFNSLTTQPAALLKRQLRQKTSNIIDTIALISSSIVSVVMAIESMGHWAIVGQLVSFNVFRFILLALMSGYKPGKPQISKKAFSLFKTGGLLAISNYICFVQLYLGSILMGHLFSTVDLGYYVKANALKSMPTMYAVMVVTDIMVASLAALSHHEERMGFAYRKALLLTAFIGCPAAAMLYPLAPELIKLFYGQQWEGAAQILKLLAISAVMLPISTTTIWLFLASGKTKEQLYLNILLTAVTLSSYTLYVDKIETATELVVIEVFLFSLPLPLLQIVYSHKVTKIDILKTLRVICPILIISLISAIFSEITGRLLSDYVIHWFLLFFIKGSTGVIVYFFLTLYFIRPYPIGTVERLLKMRAVV